MSNDSFGNAAFEDFLMDDVDPDRPGSGVGQLPEGGYRVTITDVIVQNDRGSTEVKCEVTHAKDENLIGRQHTEYLRWPKPEYSDTGNRIAKEQLLAWCYAAKTTSADEIKARQAARQGFNSAWLDAMIGRSVLIVIKHDAYQDAAGNSKTSAKAEGRVWAVDDPKRKDIPGWRGPTAPAASPASQPQPVAAAADPFAHLV